MSEDNSQPAFAAVHFYDNVRKNPVIFIESTRIKDFNSRDPDILKKPHNVKCINEITGEEYFAPAQVHDYANSIEELQNHKKRYVYHKTRFSDAALQLQNQSDGESSESTVNENTGTPTKKKHGKNKGSKIKKKNLKETDYTDFDIEKKLKFLQENAVNFNVNISEEVKLKNEVTALKMEKENMAIQFQLKMLEYEKTIKDQQETITQLNKDMSTMEEEVLLLRGITDKMSVRKSHPINRSLFSARAGHSTSEDTNPTQNHKDVDLMPAEDFLTDGASSCFQRMCGLPAFSMAQTVISEEESISQIVPRVHPTTLSSSFNKSSSSPLDSFDEKENDFFKALRKDTDIFQRFTADPVSGVSMTTASPPFLPSMEGDHDCLSGSLSKSPVPGSHDAVQLQTSIQSSSSQESNSTNTKVSQIQSSSSSKTEAISKNSSTKKNNTKEIDIAKSSNERKRKSDEKKNKQKSKKRKKERKDNSSKKTDDSKKPKKKRKRGRKSDSEYESDKFTKNDGMKDMEIWTSKTEQGNIKMIHLRFGISIPLSAWKIIKVQKTATQFLRKLAKAIWTAHHLANRAINVKKCSTTLPNRSPRKALTPVKKAVLRKLYFSFINGKVADSDDRNRLKNNWKVDLGAYINYLLNKQREECTSSDSSSGSDSEDSNSSSSANSSAHKSDKSNGSEN